MQTIIVKDRQTFLDIAMQEAGSLEAALKIAFLNGMSMTDDIVSEQVIGTVPVLFPEVVGAFSKENRHPASAAVLDDESELEGIDYWAIGDDFIVG